MQCNPQYFVTGPPNCSQFYPCNPPYQPTCGPPCPDIIGEGEVTSLVLPDGTVQLYFLPTSKWNPYVQNPNLLNCNPYWNPTVGAWFIRSFTNPPSCAPFAQPSCNFPRVSCNGPIAIPQSPAFQVKFHNDSCTSTTDLCYFCPRPSNFTAQSSAEVRDKSCYIEVVEPECKCGRRDPCSCKKEDIQYESDMSIDEAPRRSSLKQSSRFESSSECSTSSGKSNRGKKSKKKGSRSARRSSSKGRCSKRNNRSEERRARKSQERAHRKFEEKERKRERKEKKKLEREAKRIERKRSKHNESTQSSTSLGTDLSSCSCLSFLSLGASGSDRKCNTKHGQQRYAQEKLQKEQRRHEKMMKAIMEKERKQLEEAQRKVMKGDQSNCNCGAEKHQGNRIRHEKDQKKAKEQKRHKKELQLQSKNIKSTSSSSQSVSVTRSASTGSKDSKQKLRNDPKQFEIEQHRYEKNMKKIKQKIQELERKEINTDSKISFGSIKRLKQKISKNNLVKQKAREQKRHEHELKKLQKENNKPLSTGTSTNSSLQSLPATVNPKQFKKEQHRHEKKLKELQEKETKLCELERQETDFIDQKRQQKNSHYKEELLNKKAREQKHHEHELQKLQKRGKKTPSSTRMSTNSSMPVKTQSTPNIKCNTNSVVEEKCICNKPQMQKDNMNEKEREKEFKKQQKREQKKLKEQKKKLQKQGKPLDHKQSTQMNASLKAAQTRQSDNSDTKWCTQKETSFMNQGNAQSFCCGCPTETLQTNEQRSNPENDLAKLKELQKTRSMMGQTEKPKPTNNIMKEQNVSKELFSCCCLPGDDCFYPSTTNVITIMANELKQELSKLLLKPLEKSQSNLSEMNEKLENKQKKPKERGKQQDKQSYNLKCKESEQNAQAINLNDDQDSGPSTCHSTASVVQHPTCCKMINATSIPHLAPAERACKCLICGGSQIFEIIEYSRNVGSECTPPPMADRLIATVHDQACSGGVIPYGIDFSNEFPGDQEWGKTVQPQASVEVCTQSLNEELSHYSTCTSECCVISEPFKRVGL